MVNSFPIKIYRQRDVKFQIRYLHGPDICNTDNECDILVPNPKPIIRLKFL